MSRECVNAAGPASRIRLETIPVLTRPVPLNTEMQQALGCWRLRRGEACTVSDPEGHFYRARLVQRDGQTVLIPFEKMSAPVESPLRLEVYQALPQKERFELVLQKLTEIGVSRVVPFTSERSITQQERDAGQKKSHRWPEVLRRAARQSRRAEIPELSPTLDWRTALCRIRLADARFFLDESETLSRLGDLLAGQPPRRVAMLVGPEGGLTFQEARDLRGIDCHPVSVGPRILRTETASIVGAALVQYILGDLS